MIHVTKRAELFAVSGVCLWRIFAICEVSTDMTARGIKATDLNMLMDFGLDMESDLWSGV